MNPIYAASTGKNVGINPGWNHFAKYTYAPAIARDGFLFFTGLTASAAGGGIMHPGDIVAQTEEHIATCSVLGRFAPDLAVAEVRNGRDGVIERRLRLARGLYLMAITLGGILMDAVQREQPPLVNRIDASAPTEVVRELRDRFPDFARACDPGALAAEEFRVYGPVVRFQKSFLDGFELLTKQVRGVA